MNVSKSMTDDMHSILPVKGLTQQSLALRNPNEFKAEIIDGPITIAVDRFGYLGDESEPHVESLLVKRFTFFNRNRMCVQVITYGATITSMKVPSKTGVSEDVIMGFENIEGYLGSTNPSIGGTIGRVANRIENGLYTWGSMEYVLNRNENKVHHLNGGYCGFDKQNWEASLTNRILTMTLISKDGSEGYPGTVMARATFELKNNNAFHVTYAATTSLPTPLNLSNNLCFNLGGHGSGFKELYKHIVTINADKHLLIDDEQIPTGQIQCVGGTPYDLRIPHELGPAIARCPGGGYENYFCVTQGTEQTLTFVARIIHPMSGRVLELYSDQPGVQFSTCDEYPDPTDDIHPVEVFTQDFYEIPSTRKISVTKNSDCLKKKHRPVAPTDDHYDDGEEEEGECIDEMEGEETQSCMCSIRSSCPCSTIPAPIDGKYGAQYLRHGAFCLNTQKYPDAVNNNHFPNIILQPGQMYKHEIVYSFGLHIGVSSKIVYPPEEFNEDEEEEIEEEEQPQH